jgi:hypothetical protein
VWSGRCQHDIALREGSAQNGLSYNLMCTRCVYTPGGQSGAHITVGGVHQATASSMYIYSGWPPLVSHVLPSTCYISSLVGS